LKTSYDAETRALSPATVLRARLIESLIQRGIVDFDFPGEPYTWESQWTDALRWRTVLNVYRRSPRALLLYGLERLKHRSSARTLQHIDPRRARGQAAPAQPGD